MRTVPSTGGNFEEYETPGSGRIVGTKEASHTDETRRYISYGLLCLLGTLTVLTLVSFIVGWLTTDELKESGILITPVFTLAGTALGFYFGANKD